MDKSSSSSLFDHQKMGLKKGPWKPEEDQKLLAYIQQHGHGSWRSLPFKAGLQRCGKSCRLRWTNYLRPDIKRGKFTQHEEQTIIQLHALLGNRWSTIANHLPKRTDNEIKNYWNTHLKKKLTKMGIDPMTHKPKNHPFIISHEGQPKYVARLSHAAQWESARLEAEARLVRQSKLGISSSAYKYYNENFLKKCANHTPHPLTVAPPRPVPCLDVLKAWASTNSRRNNIPFNGFFHDLESSTSILFEFPEKMQSRRNPNCGLLYENVLGDDDRSRDGVNGVNENSPMDQLDRVITTPPNVETDMHHVAGESLVFQSFVEGFNDVRFISNGVNAGYYNGVEGSSGVYEESKKNNYWGSPMLMLEEM